MTYTDSVLFVACKYTMNGSRKQHSHRDMLITMKISRFHIPDEAPDENERFQEGTSPIEDHSDLDRLYPHAKTFDEQSQDDEDRQQRFTHRQMKHPHFKVASSGAVVIAASIIFLQTVGSYWLNLHESKVFSVVFMSFFGALVLAAAVFAWIRFANNTLYASTAAGWPFWVIAIGVSLAELFGLLSVQLYAGPGSSLYLPVILFFVILYVALKIITLKRR